MKKKTVIILSIVGALLVLAFILYLIPVSKNEKRLKIVLPDGRTVYAVKLASKLSDRITKDKKYTSIEGKIEEINAGLLPEDITTRIVLITNSREMVVLLNPSVVNTIRMAYVGKLVIMKGYWFDKVPFRGKMYKSFWVEEVYKREEIRKSNKKTEGKKGGVADKKTK